jgi:hypothetical protein
VEKQMLLQRGRRKEIRIFDEEFQDEAIQDAIKDGWKIISIIEMLPESETSE